MTRFCVLLMAFSFLLIGCGDGGSSSHEAVCEHQNTLCEGIEDPNDCSTANDVYNAGTPEQKAFLDKLSPCVLNANSCDDITACYLGAI